MNAQASRRTPQGILRFSLFDRTGLLLHCRHESFDDLAFHTGTDKRRIVSLAYCGSREWAEANPDQLVVLHNWLIVMELAATRKLVGPDSELVTLGIFAVPLERERILNARSGLIAISECWRVLQNAQSNLDALLESCGTCASPSRR